MTVKMSRFSAEKEYFDWFVERGNPHYFIYRMMQKMENHELEELFAESFAKEIEILDEE